MPSYTFADFQNALDRGDFHGASGWTITTTHEGHRFVLVRIFENGPGAKEKFFVGCTTCDSFLDEGTTTPIECIERHVKAWVSEPEPEEDDDDDSDLVAELTDDVARLHHARVEHGRAVNRALDGLRLARPELGALEMWAHVEAVLKALEPHRYVEWVVPTGAQQVVISSRAGAGGGGGGIANPTIGETVAVIPGVTYQVGFSDGHIVMQSAPEPAPIPEALHPSDSGVEKALADQQKFDERMTKVTAEGFEPTVFTAESYAKLGKRMASAIGTEFVKPPAFESQSLRQRLNARFAVVSIDMNVRDALLEIVGELESLGVR